MPLIPYPDIPKLPGVPAIPRSPKVPTPAPVLSTTPPVPVNSFGTQWGFIGLNGESVITPDSFIDFEYREERKIPTYPIEGGAFQSYNKVALPFDVRVTISCNGNGAMTKENFLSTIELLISSLTLINVITPNYTYENCNLVHFDYRRESKQGVSLIIAQLWFQEVRVVQAAIPVTSQPSGTPAQNNGQVSPVPPTKKQKSQITAKKNYIDFGTIGKTTGNGSWD